MSVISEEFLPPEEYLPQKIIALEELRYPDKFNLVASFSDSIKDWNKVALHYGDDRITYSDLRRNINKLANGLESLGVERKDRVMVKMLNRPEFIYAVGACWIIGVYLL